MQRNWVKFGLVAGLIGVIGSSMFAASALAVSPSWQISGAEFTGAETTSLSQVVPLIIGNKAFEIKCTEQATKGEIKNTDEHQTGGGSAYSGCSVVGTEKLCTVRGESNGVGSNQITTAALKGELKKVGTKIYVVIEPVSGTTFAKLIVEGTGCSHAGTYVITGKTAAEVGTAAVETKLVMSEEVAKAAGTELKLGTEKASMSGTALIKNTGTSKGKTIGAA
jgi:hypothetical protein